MSRVVDLQVMYQTRTDKAVCVNGEKNLEKDVWLPLDETEVFEDLDLAIRGDLINVTIPEWLAEREGLI